MVCWLTALLLSAPVVALPTRLTPEALAGLDPRNYRLARPAQPEAARELLRLRLPPAVLVEGYLNATMPPGPRAGDSPTLTRTAIAEARAKELTAFKAGVLTALGHSQPTSAAPFLLQVAQDSQTTTPLRSLALLSLGKLRDLRLLPYLLNTAETAEPPLARAAVSALGQMRSVPAVMALTTLLAKPQPIETVNSTLLALGVAGSADEPAAASVRRAASETLLAELSRPTLVGSWPTLLEALSVAADANTLADLKRIEAHGTKAARSRAREAHQRVARTLARKMVSR